MKILYAPYNIASMPAITVEVLNKFENITARGICIDSNKFLYFGNDGSNHWMKFSIDSNVGKNWLCYFYNLLLAEIALTYRIIWCDVIIWQWDIKKYLPHYWLIKLLNKPIFVEWLGSDIRIPELVFKYNKYYKNAWENGIYTYTKESKKRSQEIQNKFKNLNAIPLLCPEMTLFLNRKLFRKYIVMFQRINISKFNVKFPLTEKKVPVICHAPSAMGAKGTYEIRKIINNLECKYNFKYIEIFNVAHQEAISIIEDCDIFLDQFVLGAYGMATCEALSMGKPVFCYIMDEVKMLLPKDCPILSFGLDELENEIIKLIVNPVLRNEIGKASRRYVEQYHDSTKLVLDLVRQIEHIKTC